MLELDQVWRRSAQASSGLSATAQFRRDRAAYTRVVNQAHADDGSTPDAMIEQLRVENAQLSAEVDRLRNQAVLRWAELIHTRGIGVSEYENTLSWRITKPLRVVRRGQIAVRELGFVNVVRTVAARLLARFRRS